MNVRTSSVSWLRQLWTLLRRTPLLVAPRTLETAEAHSVNSVDGEVKINNRWREWLTAVVVAFDG